MSVTGFSPSPLSLTSRFSFKYMDPFRSRPAINYTMSLLWTMRKLNLFSPIDLKPITKWKQNELLDRESSRNYEQYLCHQAPVELFRR